MDGIEHLFTISHTAVTNNNQQLFTILSLINFGITPYTISYIVNLFICSVSNIHFLSVVFISLSSVFNFRIFL
jgi:hypothetical protein